MKKLLEPPASNRERAWQIMRAALNAVEPGAAVARHLQLVASRLTIGDPHGIQQAYDLNDFDRVLVVGGGKAGAPMAATVAEILGPRLAGGVVIVKHGHGLNDAAGGGPIEIVEAGHPVPDDAGQQGAGRIISLLRNTTSRDLVLCLISGGGSALMTAPMPGISLADLQSLTQILLGCGATINEINTIRKHISQLKGGQLAQLASPAPVVSLILSDVVGDPLEVIASGPTVPDPTNFDDAWSILVRYKIVDDVPASIMSHLSAGIEGGIPDTPKPGNPIFGQVRNFIIGSNRLAAAAAAQEAQLLGFDTILLTTFLEGEAREVGKVMAGLAKGLAREETMHPAGQPLSGPTCLILGGETTVTLRGNGKGGRNQEMALAAALSLENWQGVLIANLATDGTDGPTDAAGAYADGHTIARATRLGLDAKDHLERNDSYHFFKKLGDLIVTGPTKTNVNDLALIFVSD
ncbi:MAG: glycerate kinase [Anaerolineales bacterium]|nr:MAG: glycerate kinase [Anaerolineales bacterium]